MSTEFNIFSYVVSPKHKLLLHLKQKVQASSDMMDFIFPKKKAFSFIPGQYMEWTLAHPHTDSRGNRRYFTIASSPTEDTLRLGVRFYEKQSSFKKAMLKLNDKTTIVGSQVAGDFTLPKDKNKKLVFIAGGIGITPFRSMLKYLVDRNEKRSIILLYSNRTIDEIMYKDIFDQAESTLGIKTMHTLTDIKNIPPDWMGGRGRIDAMMIKQIIPDYLDRTFYLSGPQSMVQGYEIILKSLGVSSTHIKNDFFPGLV